MTAASTFATKASVIPIDTASPVATAHAAFVLSEPGVYDLIAEVWDERGARPPIAALEPLTGHYVLWKAVHRTTRQVIPSLGPIEVRQRQA